jgi:transposase, IS5 family
MAGSAVEGPLYGSLSARQLAGREMAPDETTICRFRQLLGAHDFVRRMTYCAFKYLEFECLPLSSGTGRGFSYRLPAVFNQNEEKVRDPGMRRTHSVSRWLSHRYKSRHV